MNVSTTILSIGTVKYPSLVRLLWETDRTYNSIRTFKIYRGTSHAEQNELLGEVSTTPGESVFSFNDTTPMLYDFYRDLFYRVDQYFNGVLEKSSDPSNWNLSYQLQELAMMSDQEILFHYDSGSPIFLHAINKSYNIHCPKCYDISTGKVRAHGSCAVCMGTGRQDPYLKPYLIWPEFGSTSRQNTIEEFGELQPGQRTITQNGIPSINPKDILHDPIRHQMWNVVTVNEAGRLGAPVVQKIVIARLDPSAQEYEHIKRSVSNSDILVKELIDIQQERRF